MSTRGNPYIPDETNAQTTYFNRCRTTFLETALVRRINAGRCFALVGAGASVELGYPTWRTLSTAVRDHVLGNNASADPETYERFLAHNDLPAVFGQAEVDLGGRESLITLVKNLFDSCPRTGHRAVYDYVAKWPFACYLTTNYDNVLKAALRKIGQHFQVVHNSPEDLAHLRNGVSHLIVKLHSDLDHPHQVVLTSRDYDRIISSPEGAYFRDKLRQVFEMFDLVIVGHSMSDPDLQLILRTAKHTASPIHPIYMIVANATSGDAREYRERYNIHLLLYEDSDGSHAQLRRMLSVTDRWVAPRAVSPQTPLHADEEELQAATSLFIHRRLRAIVVSGPVDELFGPLVLGIISAAGTSVNSSQIRSHPAIAPLTASYALDSAIDEALVHLATDGYLTRKGDAFAISASGKRAADQTSHQRELEEDQALGQFELDFKQQYPAASATHCDLAKSALRDGLVASFRKRGLAMANVIVAGQSLRSDELPDIFHEISQASTRFTGFAERAAFIEAAHRFLVHPNEPQQRYLASVSQGYFLYHLAGLDPTCAKIRQELFDRTC